MQATRITTATAPLHSVVTANALMDLVVTQHSGQMAPATSTVQAAAATAAAVGVAAKNAPAGTQSTAKRSDNFFEVGIDGFSAMTKTEPLS